MRAKLRKEERYDTGNVVQYHNKKFHKGNAQRLGLDLCTVSV